MTATSSSSMAPFVQKSRDFRSILGAGDPRLENGIDDSGSHRSLHLKEKLS
ncbi:hypothetical protein Mapa_008182 [Marchantia paleacea]|nr:hypothetical protein Mapa_008182 [Marchantia paleacea]